MAIERFNRDEISSHLDCGDKGLIFRVETCKKKRDLFLLFKRLINGNKDVHKASEFVEIISYGRIPFLES